MSVTESIDKNFFVNNNLFSLSIKDVDWKTDKVISHSQYALHSKCPKAWELKYIHTKRFSDESIFVVFGQAMHTVVQEWLKQIYTVSVKSSNEIDWSARLKEELISEYKIRVEKNGGHFSSPEELSKYLYNGTEILNFLKKKRAGYFSTKGMKLIAIELPLCHPPVEEQPNVKFIGSIDLVFYDSKRKRYLIIDLKTSKKGWKDWHKKDKVKTDQIILYKKYFSEQFNVPIDNIDVEFMIFRSEIDPDAMWPVKRIQEFKPSDGKVSVNRAVKNVEEFIRTCFNEDGSYNTDKIYVARAGDGGRNCRFCPYADKYDLCPKENRRNV